MRVVVTATVALFLTGTAAAQGGPPTPLPDHWLTLDSLAAAVGLTAEQRTKVAEPYAALNAVLKQAATKRAAMRSTMGGMRRTAPDEMTPAEREAMRARMDSVRAEFADLQAEADEWHVTIRNLLSPAQQAKFDALPKPRTFPEMRRRMGAPPGGA